MLSRFSVVASTVVAMALVLASCGTDAEVTDDDVTTGDPTIAGVCAPDHPDCVDTVVVNDDEPSDSDEPLFIEDEPTDGATPRASSGLVVGGGLTISEVLTTDATGVLAVQGFYFADASGTRLCELLAESYPPQCGGESIVVHDIVAGELGPIQIANGVEWTDGVVTVFGELTDGALIVSGNVSG